ncbi:MAG: hypothetical protein LBG42_03345, partial [Treponema sp.]|nr:hypothetical protein [Treponema sp.]
LRGGQAVSGRGVSPRPAGAPSDESDGEVPFFGIAAGFPAGRGRGAAAAGLRAVFRRGCGGFFQACEGCADRALRPRPRCFRFDGDEAHSMGGGRDGGGLPCGYSGRFSSFAGARRAGRAPAMVMAVFPD